MYLYQRKQRDGSLGGPIWGQFSVEGRRVRVSLETEDWAEARRKGKILEGKAASGQPILAKAGKTTYDELLEDVLVHYQSTGQRDLREVGWRTVHLSPFFGGMKASAITGTVIAKYIQHRQAEGASNGSVNREVGVLRKMLRSGYEHDKIAKVPVIHLPEEKNVRQGFFERDTFEAIRRHLPLDLQCAITISYTFGWRVQSEVMSLKLAQVDLARGTLRLEPGTTKNDDGREVALTTELRTLLAEQVARVQALSKAMQKVCPYLFPHLTSHQRPRGTQKVDFRDAWSHACIAAGHAKQIRHDFRRTAVRNMVNAGVPERVAMSITGHKTRAVFDRYHIVSPADLRAAAEKITAAATTEHTTGSVVALPVANKPKKANG
jgi:integrase